MKCITLLINTDRHFEVLLPNVLVANEQKNRNVMHGNSKAKKVILGNRVRKVRNDKVHKEKGLIKRKARGHIEHEGRERHEHVG